jgi:hypothetical protein
MSHRAPVKDIARRVAAQLAPDLGATLPEQVEQAIAEDPLDRPAERIFDPISVGAFMVSIASLGWTIYHDLKKDRATAKRDQTAEAAQLSADLKGQPEAESRPAKLTPEQHDLIITAVAAEIVRSDFV